MMDAKARLTEILDRRMEPTRPSLVAGLLADAVLAEFDLTPKPPQPTGPVTSEEAWAKIQSGRRMLVVASDSREDRLAVDAAMPLLARDHGLLTPAEVERRAREWADSWGYSGAVKINLVEALTNKDERNGNV